MSGINAIVNLQEKPIKREKLHQMNETMKHRGPDGQGLWLDRYVGLGSRQLAINNVSRVRQPLSNEDGTLWLVWDGTIDLDSPPLETSTLKGQPFYPAGNAEAIFNLYERYGHDCVQYLRGAFAFILWDAREDVLFAARDHFGIKPLFYSYDSETVICSSELKSILYVENQSKTLDRQSLLHYLTYQYVPAPRTMIEGIWKLPPAHRLIVQGGKLRLERYWQPTFTPTEQPASELRKTVQMRLRDAVMHATPNNEPAGSFLSSGIDSTAITAMMRREGPLHTFSVGFQGEHNECLIARQTAQLLDTDHHEWIVSEQDYFNVVEKCLWYQEEPIADPSAIALYLLSQLASQYVKVILSGEGADECFGGYRVYQEPFALAALQWLPPSYKETLHTLVRPLPHFYGKNYLLRATSPIENRFVGNAKIFTDEINALINEDEYHHFTDMSNAFEWAQLYYEEVQSYDAITKMQHIDLSLWLPGNILAKADKMSLAHSLDLRLPFLDLNLFEVARKIPTAYRVDRKTTKRILREALRGIVPHHMLRRPKLGFPVPLRQWLRGARGDDCLSVIRSSEMGRYFNMTYVEQLVRQHQSGKADHARKIWLIYVLAQWHTLFLTESQSDYPYANSL